MLEIGDRVAASDYTFDGMEGFVMDMEVDDNTDPRYSIAWDNDYDAIEWWTRSSLIFIAEDED